MRHAPDRLLHAWRRQVLRRRIRHLPHPVAVVFICHGNICRSPYAEVVLRGILREIPARSAGFIGPGRAPPREALDAAARRGHRLDAHLSRLLEELAISAGDLLVVMEPAQARALRSRGVPMSRLVVLGDLDPLPLGTRAIRDPWGTDAAVFDAVYERIDRCVAELAGCLRA
jgi:protein-tyrosine phosphatase